MSSLAVALVLLVLGLILLAVGVVAAIGILITALEAAAILAAVGIFIIGVALVIDRFRPAPAACGLVRRAVLRDTCEGACPPGRICAAVTTRPYGPRLLGLAPQAATCACLAGAPGGGAPAPGSGGDDG
ncbi:MAG TPA: hypothetical protein VLE23_13450 [Geminicoccaceae bacterium]|nr:hypothetical protein [Geminicoccaceae bacterium]